MMIRIATVRASTFKKRSLRRPSMYSFHWTPSFGDYSMNEPCDQSSTSSCSHWLSSLMRCCTGLPRIACSHAMINLNFHLWHPFSNRWANIYNTGGRITQHKSWEFQIMKTNTIFEVSLRFTTSGDHAGLNVGVRTFGI